MTGGRRAVPAAAGPRRVRVAGDLFHGRVPAGAVYVGRAAPGLPASPYRNRHRVGRCRPCGLEHDRAAAVAAYADDLTAQPALVAAARAELGDVDLACWCRPGELCHADVLLSMVGEGPPRKRDPVAGAGWLAVPLETPRLLVRAPAPADRTALEGLLTDSQVRQHVSGALSAAAAAAAVTRALAGLDGDHFVIADRAGGAVVGSGDIRRRPATGPELSYQLAARRWGYGYASEALTAVLTAFFAAVDEPALTALTQTANTRSVALLERLGATLHGREQYKGHPQLRYRWSAPGPASGRL